VRFSDRVRAEAGPAPVVVLALRESTDGVGLHHTRTKSFYHLIITFLDLPPWLRDSWEFKFPTFILSGPSSDHFQLALCVHVEELLTLERGIKMQRQNDDGSFSEVLVFAMLVSTMCDAKADPKLSLRFQARSKVGFCFYFDCTGRSFGSTRTIYDSVGTYSII
jgi:hypothetical protein